MIVDINDPLKPRVAAEVRDFKHASAVAVQFRYAFVVDESGLKVVDVTVPEKAKLVEGASVHIEEGHNVYVARTYAYVAAGKNGLAIVDIEKREKPKLDQTYNAEGVINDLHDVKIGMTNNSLFAYLADGRNGLRVVQLLSPDANPEIYGFSPRPTPRLIATFPMKGEALALSKGIDRDRAVDESGNQMSVFNRRGARPFNMAEMQRMYLRDGQLFTVTDDVPARPRRPAAAPRTSGAAVGISWADFGSAGLMHLFIAFLLLAGTIRLKRRTTEHTEKTEQTDGDGRST